MLTSRLSCGKRTPSVTSITFGIKRYIVSLRLSLPFTFAFSMDSDRKTRGGNYSTTRQPRFCSAIFGSQSGSQVDGHSWASLDDFDRRNGRKCNNIKPSGQGRTESSRTITQTAGASASFATGAMGGTAAAPAALGCCGRAMSSGSTTSKIRGT